MVYPARAEQEEIYPEPKAAVAHAWDRRVRDEGSAPRLPRYRENALDRDGDGDRGSEFREYSRHRDPQSAAAREGSFSYGQPRRDPLRADPTAGRHEGWRPVSPWTVPASVENWSQKLENRLAFLENSGVVSFLGGNASAIIGNLEAVLRGISASSGNLRLAFSNPVILGEFQALLSDMRSSPVGPREAARIATLQAELGAIGSGQIDPRLFYWQLREAFRRDPVIRDAIADFGRLGTTPGVLAVNQALAQFQIQQLELNQLVVFPRYSLGAAR
jgi:hypothetical protein